jgi:pyrroloquinoline quinone (PQQ) biosynthesis protein C
MIKISPHPDWLKELLDVIQPYQDRVAHHRFFEEFKNGRLTIKQCQGALINFYPLIESFPQYMALSLAKIPAGDSKVNRKARHWLISNINQERLHTRWWRQFAYGFSVDETVLDDEIYPPPEIDALNNYLWRICTHGSLVEGMSASNFAVEGATGEWTKNISHSFEKYCNADGIKINERTLEWVVAHATYDDRHPVEALEIINAYATTKEEQKRVRQAAKRALEYYDLALDACYEIYK